MIGIAQSIIATPKWLETPTRNWILLPNFEFKLQPIQPTLAAQREALEKLVRQGAVDGFVFPLSKLPHYNDDLVITALSERQHDHLEIWRKPEGTDSAAPLGIAATAQLIALESTTAAVLRDLFPHHKVIDAHDNLTDWQAAWSTNNAVAFVDPAFAKCLTPPAQGGRTQPQELVPPAGSNVLAAVTRKDHLEFRRLLKPFHHRPTGFCTNIERTMAFNQLGNAYCHQDRAGNYSAFFATATSPVQRARFSSSTRFQLAENTLRQLNT